MPHQQRRWSRTIAALAIVTGLTGIAPLSVTAADPSAAVGAAKGAVQQAQAHAAAQDGALAQAQSNLAAAQQQLATLQAQVTQLDGRVADAAALATRLGTRATADRDRLRSFLRLSYEQGDNVGFVYVLSADDLQSAIQRQDSVQRVAGAGTDLLARIRAEEQAAQAALAVIVTERERLATAQAQAATETVLVSNETEQIQATDAAAHQSVAAARNNLAQALQQQKAYDEARSAAAALAGRLRTGVVFTPVSGAGFSIDTDLTRPSGETAARLNGFLQGTALHGLGDAFTAAEKAHGVSARYLVAHAIEESAFGASQIAQDKHNLFGYGADDAHPYQDAVTFPTFAACIDTVAAKVATNYLSSTGVYFHGATLRGMNVDYASDPSWATNISRLANSFP